MFRLQLFDFSFLLLRWPVCVGLDSKSLQGPSSKSSFEESSTNALRSWWASNPLRCFRCNDPSRKTPSKLRDFFLIVRVIKYIFRSSACSLPWFSLDRCNQIGALHVCRYTVRNIHHAWLAFCFASCRNVDSLTPDIIAEFSQAITTPATTGPVGIPIRMSKYVRPLRSRSSFIFSTYDSMSLAQSIILTAASGSATGTPPAAR